MTLKKMIEHYIEGDIGVESKASRSEIMDIANRDAEIKKLLPVSWNNDFGRFFISTIANVLQRIDYICLEYLQKKHPCGYITKELSGRLNWEQKINNPYPGRFI